jgi:hypothetical protein
MFPFNPEKYRIDVRQAETDDLLDRLTAYRRGMDAQAIPIIEEELSRRGVMQGKLHVHAKECRKQCLFDANGVAFTCSKCRRPAVTEIRTWHKLFGLVPVFPKRIRLCKIHATP